MQHTSTTDYDEDVEAFKAFIEELGLNISGSLGVSLLHKRLELHLGVVELGVRIDQLMEICEELETFRQTLLVSMPLGERAHNLRMINQECR